MTQQELEQTVLDLIVPNSPYRVPINRGKPEPNFDLVEELMSQLEAPQPWDDVRQALAALASQNKITMMARGGVLIYIGVSEDTGWAKMFREALASGVTMKRGRKPMHIELTQAREALMASEWKASAKHTVAVTLGVPLSTADNMLRLLQRMKILTHYGSGWSSRYNVIDPTGEISPERIREASRSENERVKSYRKSADTRLHQARIRQIWQALEANEGNDIRMSELLESLGFKRSTVAPALIWLRDQGIYRPLSTGGYQILKRLSD